MVHLNKARLQKGIPNKFQMRRLGPCAILARYGENAYKVDLPSDIGLSPVFNIADLVAYKGTIQGLDCSHSEVLDDPNNLQLPAKPNPKAEKVLSSRIAKKTRHKIYWENLIKW
ncbi:hypothetical protein SUGI_1109930 [Cryptomeria japonica]|nr:hypothetical protein SUGI_1109930 [Cryptomeria japonica]